MSSLFNHKYKNFRVVVVYDDLPDEFILEDIKSAILATDPARTVLIVNPTRLGYWDSISIAIN